MKLNDGREVKVNLNNITILEWRLMWKPDTEDKVSDEIFARCVGMTIDEIEGVSMRDFQRIAKAIRDAAANPDDDEKNSASASTSD